MILAAVALALLPMDLVISPPETRTAGLPSLEAGRLMLAEQQYRIGYDLAIQQRNAQIAAVCATNIGSVAYMFEQYDSAEVWYQRALQYDPQHADAIANLASVVFVRAKAQDSVQLAEQALALYEQALTIHPNNTATIRNAAVVLEALGRADKARLGYLLAERLEAGRAAR